MQTAVQEMRTEQGTVKRGRKFADAKWLDLIEYLPDGSLKYTAAAPQGESLLQP